MNLPPQAYTKETLIQAYNWLRSQPSHVQEMAKSPDILVSLYTKAQIHGENYLSRTNLQNFKSELKSLAHIMGDLDDDFQGSSQMPFQGQNQINSTNTSQGQNKSTSASQPNQNINSIKASNAQTNNISNTTAGGSNLYGGPQTMMSPVVSDSPNLPLLSALAGNSLALESDLKSLLDARSWGMIQEIKNHLNLSSESEAIRLLIAIGYQKIRSQI